MRTKNKLLTIAALFLVFGLVTESFSQRVIYNALLRGTTTVSGPLNAIADVSIDGSASGLSFTGAYTNSALNFSDVTLDHSGSSGPVMIRAGTYANPVSSSDPHQSGMIRLYGTNSATTDDGTGFYDRGIFVYNRITGNKSAFPIAGLVEVRDVGGEDGPLSVQAGQFIVGLHTSTAKLAATAGTTDGMFGAWFKVYSASGSVAAATSRVAPIWLDSSMGGTVNGEEYSIFATSGGRKIDAFVGFETGNNQGWSSLFYFDETAHDEDPVGSGDITGGTNGFYLKVNLNGTMYAIQLYAL